MIREPVIQAEAIIDHDLAEQLLNDSAKESDALPVLQHVLMRLWDQACSQDGIAGGGKRRLSMDLYDRIGCMSNALSIHADSVMKELAKNDLGSRAELIVEQVMRALIEVDRQGRAIRRPIRFRQLVDETGFGEPDVKKAVEAMRAETRSFLRPGPPENLDDDTHIDIGHEALMRCWRRISDPKDGWLVEEFRSDLRWRSLLVQAESFEADSSNVLPPAMIEERAKWLKTLNAAWALRYGGGWERVQRLMHASLEESKKRKAEEEASRRLQENLRDYVQKLSKLRLGMALLLVLLAVCLMLAYTAYRESKGKNEAVQRLATELDESKRQFEVATNSRNAEAEARAAAEAARAESDALAQKNEKLAKDLQDVVSEMKRAAEAAPSETVLQSTVTKAETQIKDQIGNLTDTASSSPPISPQSTSGSKSPRLYIHIADNNQRSDAHGLELKLETLQLGGAAITVPGIQLVKASPPDSELRCFRSEECSNEAKELLQKINGLLSTPEVRLQDLSGRYGNTPPGHYELWFAPGPIQLKTP